MIIPKKVFISHQDQCDENEIEGLVEYLKNHGFDVEHGKLSSEDFAKIIATTESYVCVLEQNTYKSEEIAKEILTAASQGKNIFAIFCPTLTMTITIPSAIEDFATGITDWNIEKLGEGLIGKDIGFSDQQGKPKKVFVKPNKPPCN